MAPKTVDMLADDLRDVTTLYLLNTSRFTHSSPAATGALLIERASKTDLVTIMSVYRQHYSNTNCIADNKGLPGEIKGERKKVKIKMIRGLNSRKEST